ncbi:hypothetical protein [Phocaeicola plebeius]|uniref:hypothetical protein n=1 Tax=Phocaeicola plebeius TaxID=310297 RepID=UPI0026EF10B8|nr:hypothetical protein [Phocaeicola plebeius]
MAIKPILLNTEMVRAILDGREGCTRRVVKPQPKTRLCYTYAGSHNDCIGKWTYPNRGAHKLWGEEYKLPENIKDEELSKRWNPPYHTDDILYVRETYGEGYEDGTYIYRADDKLADLPTFNESSKLIYHPSIYMPKEAARIWLKVTDVRVGRLQEMKPVDVIKEGAYPDCWDCLNTYGESGSQCCYGTEEQCSQCDEVMMEWEKLWNSTIKKSDLDRYGWDANPWVWIIEFERCEKPEGV